MTDLSVIDISPLALILGAIAVYVLGFVWYSDRVFGVVHRQLNALEAGPPTATAMLLGVAHAVFLAWLVGAFYVLQMENGIMRGIWAVFIVTVLLDIFAGNAFEQRPQKLGVIYGGYFVTSVILLVLINYAVRL